MAERRSWIDPDRVYSLRRQCRLAGLNWSTYCYKPVKTSPVNLELMRLIDERYMNHPEYGVPRMTDWLNDEGYGVNHKRVARLMKLMGIQAITPGPHTSRACPQHKKYPYLLRNVPIERVNQVWSMDITYIPMQQGYLYLTAVMEWFSRYVLAWDVSNSMETRFCTEALLSSLNRGRPEIFNTDQGSQFTSEEFTQELLDRGITISMDGRGRALDNVFIERLWWSVKYEDVYPKSYRDGTALYSGLGQYFRYYNQERKHSSLEKKTPQEIYIAGGGQI